MRLDGDFGDPFEILGVRCNDDIHVLRSSEDSPCVEGEATHEDELDACLGESAEKLIEGRLGQVRRAAPVNRISWWLSAMPSARFTLIGRAASLRRRSRRRASASAAAFLALSASPAGVMGTR